MPPAPVLIHKIAELRQHIGEWRRRQNVPNSCVSFVPTMGALHEGHLHLVRCARRQSQAGGPLLVVVSIFVNPLQFGPNEDFERYPRTLAEDLAKLGGLADCVFAPNAEEIFGNRAEGGGDEGVIRVSAGRIGRMVEGERRPNYFDGMLTIVAKLFNIVGPDVALLGQKDAQQFFAIRQLVQTLNFPVRIVGVETQREPDGLAMSSRNRYLGPAERERAVCVWKTLIAAKMEAKKGANLGQVMAKARRVFEEESGGEGMARLDYLLMVDKATFGPLMEDGSDDGGKFRGEAILLMAVFLGDTRLIDNIHMEIGPQQKEDGAAQP